MRLKAASRSLPSRLLACVSAIDRFRTCPHVDCILRSAHTWNWSEEAYSRSVISACSATNACGFRHL